jgi:uncharacterized protein (TIGR00266 family)
MTVVDLPTLPEVSGQSRAGLQYHLLGTVQQTLAVNLQPGQLLFSDAGAMSWMTATIQMKTNAGGGLGGMFKRMVAGGTAFIIDFEAQGNAGQVAFTADFPGKILPFELDENQALVMHKHAFICAEKSVKLDTFFSRKLGAGFFGGEGFILQKLTGPGMVFGELDGDAVEYRLQPGEVMKVEPGYVAMFESTVSFDIEMIKGLSNMVFGGEGLFLAKMTGPGRIWLHSLSPSKVAHRLVEFLPTNSNS